MGVPYWLPYYFRLSDKFIACIKPSKKDPYLDLAESTASHTTEYLYHPANFSVSFTPWHFIRYLFPSSRLLTHFGCISQICYTCCLTTFVYKHLYQGYKAESWMSLSQRNCLTNISNKCRVLFDSTIILKCVAHVNPCTFHKKQVTNCHILTRSCSWELEVELLTEGSETDHLAFTKST